MLSKLISAGRIRSHRRYGARGALALVLSGSLALAGCGGSAAQESTDTGLKKVTYLNTLPLESLTYAPELIADTNGYFKAEGLDVNFQYVNGTPPAIAAVMSGNGLLTRAGDTDIMRSIGDKNAQIVNVGTVQKGGTTIRVVSSKRNQITNAAELRGKTIGQSALGGTTEGILVLVLASQGMKLTDVEQQVVGLSAGTFNLVQGGRLDGFMTSLDTSLQVRADHPDAILLDPSEYTAAGTQAYITSTEQAKDPARQDEIQRYLRAIKSAIRFITEDKADGYADTIKLISGKYKVPSFANPDVAKAALDTYVTTWTAGGVETAAQTDPARWSATYQELVKAGLLGGGKDPLQWLK
ncbi:ABC transporter substrate-binding protein [Plantactinospora soyae]|uniref:NitT/TauT family transport system substrate-binding protein n=1 Tax=Plantactinospora soyae TaxID=1544732 RepID=A0A927QZ15_9ACTN|nr:ABC transporter substrate-binding protein [Plantactinospora soyae]MBE1488507.1 NitT/TauT family transport system substrate-binding protein [Plantactinospora soyae]